MLQAWRRYSHFSIYTEKISWIWEPAKEECWCLLWPVERGAQSGMSSYRTERTNTYSTLFSRVFRESNHRSAQLGSRRISSWYVHLQIIDMMAL